MQATMTLDDVRRKAPAVFAEDYAPNLSDRYGFISTADILKQLMDTGLVVTDARQNHARRSKVYRREHARHMLTLANPNVLEDPWYPRVHLVNDHSGHTRFHLGTGIYRLICFNGITVGRSDAMYFARHTSNVNRIVEEGLKVVLDAQDRARRAIDRWTKIELTPGQVQTFAERAAALRFGTKAFQYKADDIAATQRAEDEGRDLWRVFNRVQENLTKHGIPGLNANGRAVRSRPIRNVTMDLQFNAGLWELAETTAFALA